MKLCELFNEGDNYSYEITWQVYDNEEKKVIGTYKTNSMAHRIANNKNKKFYGNNEFKKPARFQVIGIDKKSKN